MDCKTYHLLAWTKPTGTGQGKTDTRRLVERILKVLGQSLFPGSVLQHGNVLQAALWTRLRWKNHDKQHNQTRRVPYEEEDEEEERRRSNLSKSRSRRDLWGNSPAWRLGQLLLLLWSLRNCVACIWYYKFPPVTHIHACTPSPLFGAGCTHWNTPKNLNDRFSPHTHVQTLPGKQQLVNQVSWVGQQLLLLCRLYGYIYIGLVAPTSSCDQAKRLSFPTCRVLRRLLALVRKTNK